MKFDIKREVTIPMDCSYYQVQLGFITEGSRFRWLTNKEISRGVMEAIKKRNKISIIGSDSSNQYATENA